MGKQNLRQEKLVHITIDDKIIEGNLSYPENPQGVVLFAHGAGSSRHSTRNNFVADALHEANLGTLLIDLLTKEEKEIDRRTRQIRFDVDRLSERVIGSLDWLDSQSETKDLPIGVFGSSTGAAAALIAGSARPQKVKAIVSRGGRVDMAEAHLAGVKAPTLCIVGGRDRQVLALNRQALEKLQNTTALEIIDGAGHLFEEPGALEKVAENTRKWFEKFLL